MKKLEHLKTAGGNITWYSHFGIVWQFIRPLNIKLPYEQVISLLGIYTQEK